MGNLSNSEYPDEISHDATFQQGLYCLLRQTRSSDKEIQYLFEIITYDPSVLYTVDQPDLIVCKLYGNFHWSEKV